MGTLLWLEIISTLDFLLLKQLESSSIDVPSQVSDLQFDI